MRRKESKKSELKKLETSPHSLFGLRASSEPGLGGEVSVGDEAPAYHWPRWYALVLAALAAEILFFTYLTHLFA